MKNSIKQGGQIKAHKGKQKGNELFSAHRLEGDVKNFGIKPTKKTAQVNQIPKKYL
jgi:hypothetical protein